MKVEECADVSDFADTATPILGVTCIGMHFLIALTDFECDDILSGVWHCFARAAAAPPLHVWSVLYTLHNAHLPYYRRPEPG